MESPQPARAMSIGAWSAFAGATESRVVDLIVSNLFNFCVVIGAVVMFVAVGSPIIWLGASLAVASMIMLGWLLRRDLARGRALLAIYQAPRIAVLVAVAAGYLARRPDDPVGIAPFVASALGGVLAAFGAPGWSYLLIIGTSTLAIVIMAAYAIRAVMISRRSAISIRKALQQYQPEFAVYYAARNAARYQLGMWLPYFERLNRRFVVITCHASTVPEIAELTSAPVLLPKLKSAHGRLWHLVVDSLKAAFYIQNHQANVDMLRFDRLTHIWLNHGDSDKSANYSARHAAFDKVFVSGQQGVERYRAHGVRIRPEQFAIVGRPQIERILTRDEPLPLGTPRTVLYAPTWHGGKPNTNYSSLPLGGRIVDALLQRGATVIFRPHPSTYRDPQQAGLAHDIQRQLTADRKSSGRQHVFGHAAEVDWDIPECFNHCDALITDVSSVASDFLASGKPLAMVASQQKGEAFRQAIPMARVAYVIERDLSTLPEALDELLGADSLAAERRAYRTYCLGDALGSEAPQPFFREVDRILDGPPLERRSAQRVKPSERAVR